MSGRSAPRTMSGARSSAMSSAGSTRAQPVLDVACDRGHFIRWISATERWATDIRDVSKDRSLPTSGSSAHQGSS